MVDNAINEAQININVERRHRGALNELAVAAWLLEQGYEVFRNVSPHGPVDIVGMKGGEIFLFDVKGVSTLAQNDLSYLNYRTEEQIKMGVKIIARDPCGIRIIEEKEAKERPPCAQCGKIITGWKKKYCSRECSQMACKEKAKKIYGESSDLGPVRIGRKSVPFANKSVSSEITCEGCGIIIRAHRNKRFCTPLCRARSYQKLYWAKRREVARTKLENGLIDPEDEKSGQAHQAQP